MSKIVSFIKSIRLRQVLTTFLLGALLLFNTACSGAAQAKLSDSVKAPGDGGPRPVGQNQPYEGGMNNFDDAAPGQAAKGTSSKADALVDNAARNRARGPEDAKTVLNSGRQVPERAKAAAENVKEGAKNAQREAQSVGDRVAGSAERATDKAKELGDRISKGAENVKDNVVGSDS
jgi:hypothetical protein